MKAVLDTNVFVSGVFSAVVAFMLGGVSSALAQANILPNPSFELVEPPPPTAAPPAPESWLPRTWNVVQQHGALWRCPDDPGQAHSGRRCAHFRSPLHGTAILRYGPMPVPNEQPWTVKLWARGKGQLLAAANEALPDRLNRLQEWPVAIEERWKLFEFQFQPGPKCRQWTFELATRGEAEVWLDDVFISYSGLTSLGLPPDKPVAKDEHTLLHLPFEEPLNEDAFFLKGQVRLTDEGRFGKALALGADAYVACSANENVDPRLGTVELWCKLLSPGNDRVYRPFVSVPGPEGMAFRKDQYSHIGFGFSSGWRSLSHATAMGYADFWQPGVWRHLAACWDKDLLQVFVDGKLIAWTYNPMLSKALGPELRLGAAAMELDDLRISTVVRYRLPVPPP